MSGGAYTPLGELRPSQLLYTYGIGAVVDLPHISAMIMGLEDWNIERCPTIAEERLLRDVRRFVGEQVQRLVAPPTQAITTGPWMSADDIAIVGVPVAPFPRWMRCPACSTLAPLSSGLFQLRAPTGRPDQARYVHFNCNRGKAPTVLPARFLVACEHGHLDDFPWHAFVHQGKDETCRGSLTLRELGVSGEASDVEVRCELCESPRRMSDAFGKEAKGRLPRCRARRPHLRDFEPEGCSRHVTTILLGASNSWFPVTRSILHVPMPADEALLRLVDQHWPVLSDVDSPTILPFLRKQGMLPTLADYSDTALWAAIVRYRARPGLVTQGDDIKAPEWHAFTGTTANADPDFRTTEVSPPTRWSPWISRVLLVDRLREVTALIGFTRLHSFGDLVGADITDGPPWAPLYRKPPQCIPAAEIRGEGIFLQFDEERLAQWCSEAGPLEDAFRRAHIAYRLRRKQPQPERGFPGIRYILLHTFSHAFMRALSLECGYAAASLRERIYANDRTGEPMAGVLIYTAAPDAEGTLGGLVRMGHPEELTRHLERAMAAMQLCSADPLCADHNPESEGDTLHGAACHACLFAPETSCERGNRDLDRSALVPTLSQWQRPFLTTKT